MNTLHENYYPIIILLIISILLAIVLLIISLFLGPQNPDTEKFSAYECGFDPYEDARNSFDVRFYLVAILFIIFDLEAMFFFPWSITLSTNSATSFWCMIDFIIELLVGFIYAWHVGALEWE